MYLWSIPDQTYNVKKIPWAQWRSTWSKGAWHSATSVTGRISCYCWKSTANSQPSQHLSHARRNDIVERIQFCFGNVLSKKRKGKKWWGRKNVPHSYYDMERYRTLVICQRFLFLSVFFSDKMYPCMSPLGFRRLSFFCRHVIPFFQHVTAIRILGPVPITLLPVRYARGIIRWCSTFAKQGDTFSSVSPEISYRFVFTSMYCQPFNWQVIIIFWFTLLIFSGFYIWRHE